MTAGDILLYKPRGLYGWIISLKTWHWIAHVEMYIGNGRAIAARDGIGVGEYDVRLEGLAAVYRPDFYQPEARFDLEKALEVFNRKYRGQGYDWLGLLRFAWRAKVVPDRFDNRQFCSELIARVLRDGWPPDERDPFGGEDADAIVPFQYECTPMLRRVSDPIIAIVAACF